MKVSRAGMLVAAALMSVASPVAAEEPARPGPGIFSPSRLAPYVRQAVEAQPGPSQAQASDRPKGKDSILNGALIGAAIGGVGGSALIVASRGGSDNIPRAMMNVAVLPTVFGAAVGAFVDALH
jgi:hypothetical protein